MVAANRPEKAALKIGVMGGTFDPVHIGHLIIAEEAGWQLALDKVLFVPASDPPHKQNQNVTLAQHRLEMVRRAIADNPRFELSTVETERGGLSYTVDTLTELHKIYPPATAFFFIIGADAAAELGSWHEPQRFLELTNLALVERPGYQMPLDKLHRQFPGIASQIERVEAPLIEISAHELRQRIATGAPITYLVPAAVESYIKQHQLYQAQS